MEWQTVVEHVLSVFLVIWFLLRIPRSRSLVRRVVHAIERRFRGKQ